MPTFWIFFLKKRAFTYMLMCVLSLGGVYALLAIPKESAPEVVVPIGIVVSTLRGASATDIEQLLTKEIESEAANIENVDKITSTSGQGVSSVTVQFVAKADIDKSIQDLKDAVDRAKLTFPNEADEPQVLQVNFADQPILMVSVSADLSPALFAKLGDDLETELRKVSGVSKVVVSGTRKHQVQVVVRKEALTTYGVRMDQVVAALQSANVSMPIGSITVADIDYPLTFAGEITDPASVQDIVVATNAGAPVYLRDVAAVIDGLAPPSTISRASVNGEPASNALTLNIYKKSGGDVTQIADAAVARLEELKQTTLAGAQVVVSYNSGELVQKDLSELTRVGLETVLLVLLVLLITIGWREAVVAALSIPLSFVIAFIGLYVSGNTINFVSLFSLILAIGILVDSGIVVTEAIHTRLARLGNGYDAAVASIREYAWPLIAGTVATIAVFAPLFFLSGIVGKFISSIPFTVIFVLVASIFVALGMVPLLALLFTKHSAPNRLEVLQEEYAVRAQTWYKNFLRAFLSDRKKQNWLLSLLGVGFVLSLALPVAGFVKVEFFPQDDQDFVYIEVERLQGTPLLQTDKSTREVEEFLYTNPYVESFVTTVGAGSSFNQSGGGSNTKVANITVLLPKDRSKTSTEIVQLLRTELAAVTTATIRVEEASGGPSSGTPVSIAFTGDDLPALTEAANKAEIVLAGIPGAIDVQSSVRDNGTQFTIEVDRAKAASVGLSAAQVAQALRIAVSGSTATTIKTPQDDIDVVVKMNLNAAYVHPEDTNKTTIDSLKQIPLSTPTGTVLLGSLITASADESRAAITHTDQKRVVTVTSKLATGANALEVTNEFKKQIAAAGLPSGVTADYGGESEDVNQSFAEMGLALLAGMALMLGILVLSFNSFRYTMYLLLTIPLSLIGVLAGLALSGMALSFSSLLGVIALAGVIINHAIILLDSVIHKLQNEAHLGLKEGIVEAAAVRLRPIVLTTITTVVGMIPLAGASSLWGPLAFTIMFGLTFAMILTLVMVPVLFYRWPGSGVPAK
jgi:multidrug efflux pump subunit AcrB